jgi:hypothetical protein
MIRFMDSIPVLAKEGGFFPLDARKHTNSISTPDSLNVMSFCGNGEYVLREDDAITRFCAAQTSGKQIVTIKASEGAMTRKIALEMRNIKKGNVSVFKNGASIEAEVKEGDFITVILEKVLPDTEYTIEVEFEINMREYRNDAFLKALTYAELSNAHKKNLWNLRDLDDKELMRRIMTDEKLTSNEQILFTEAW